MTLVDTSVWVDHLRHGDPVLAALLEAGAVLAHPFVVGEIALGTLRDRVTVLRMLARLPRATVATDAEVLRLIQHEPLFGSGIGYVDAHLLAAARLTEGARLWTRDKRLDQLAERAKVATAGG